MTETPSGWASRDDNIIRCGTCHASLAVADSDVLSFYPDIFRGSPPVVKGLPLRAHCPLCGQSNNFDSTILRLPANQTEAKAAKLRQRAQGQQ